MAIISVIIRTYTEARLNDLLAAVRSVEQQTLSPDEIIVVVDHNPALFESVHLSLPSARVVENGEPRGSSGGWNTGLRLAKGRILAFMDDDAIAAPDWLEQLWRGYRNDDVIGVGGDIIPAWVDRRPKWFPEEFDWVVGCTYRGLSPDDSQVRNLIGCNMSFRREVFDVVGGFRGADIGIGHVGAMPIGCDETHFCIRIGQQLPGKVLLFRPQAKVYHRVPVARAVWRYFLSRCYYEGRSKARVARLVGTRDGLASERVHVVRALPQGVFRGLSDLFASKDTGGLGRAGAIVAGFAFAVAGFIVETLRGQVQRGEVLTRQADRVGGQHG